MLTLIGERESYGYELVERLSTAGIEAGTGLVYPVLTRFEREHLVSSRTAPSRNGPPRRYFSLTPAGERARDEAAQQWQQIDAAVDRVINAGRDHA
jgi:PadR family transcriptional regulator PadR